MAHPCDCLTDSRQEETAYQTLHQVIVDYDRDPKNLIQILHMAQAIFGYLPEATQRYICTEMDLPFSRSAGLYLSILIFQHSQKGDIPSRCVWERPVTCGAAKRCLRL